MKLECASCSSRSHSWPHWQCHLVWQLRRHIYDSSLPLSGGIYDGAPVWFEMN